MMEVSIPIYIQQQRVNGVENVSTQVLFHPAHRAKGVELGRTISKLSNHLRDHLGQLARGSNHGILMQWNCDETFEDRTVKLRLDLRDATASVRLLLVVQYIGDRRIVFSPSLADLWFDLESDEDLEERAAQFYEQHFRSLRKDNPGLQVDERYGLRGKAWIDWLNLEIAVGGKKKKKVDPTQAFLGGEDVSDGASELRQVGRCLNHLDIDQLAEPVGVDDSLKQLKTLLSVGDRRGVVLVGPPGSGKTARIEGVVRTMRSKKLRRLTWHLTPARIISGMSYLGQWQQRVLAILQHAHQRDFILYFDDLLGLLEAGKTRDSSMCVADMMRTQLETHPVRLLAEMTSEAWAIFRRRDPKLASRLVVMRVGAMDAEQSMGTMIQVRQQIEARHRCTFAYETLPEWVSLYDRYDSSRALPGKVISAMKSLAAKMPRQSISRQSVLADFSTRTGLRRSVIDRQQSIPREELERQVRRTVIGQDAAVASLLDRAMVVINRLNNRSRPLGTFLLVGPTGVGKTELAKAIANCLFEGDGLIRLDMNELSGPGAASRLIGTFDAPDGLLTAAVRRRPHAVLLLDEIEKADPSVLDVLLPALGEARLSDARGRTVDLSGLLVLMTSNLGTRHSLRSTGFVSDPDRHAVRLRHEKAVRDFFRPEFFNRIDDVLHFEPLGTETIEEIAAIQFRRLLRRDGLQRRNVLIDIDPATIRQTALRGVDTKMGARSLKRQIERDLIRPTAEVLATTPANTPVLLQLMPPAESTDGHASTGTPPGDVSRPKAVSMKCSPIEYVKRSEPVERPIEYWVRLSDELTERASKQTAGTPIRYETGGTIDEATLECLAIRETVSAVQQLRDSLLSAMTIDNANPQATPVRQPSGTPNADKRYGEANPKSRRQDFSAYLEIQDYWNDRLSVNKPSDVGECVRDLRVELGRLESQLRHRGRPSKWRVTMRWFGDPPSSRSLSELDEAVSEKRGIQSIVRHVSIPVAIIEWLKNEESLTADFIDGTNPILDERCHQIALAGALSSASVNEIAGGWMVVDENGKTSILQVTAESVDESTEDQPAVKQSSSISPIRRIIHANDGNLDILAGFKTPSGDDSSVLRQFLRQTYLWSAAKYVDSDATGAQTNGGAVS